MWPSAFLVSTQRVTFALLCKPVLPRGGKAFERVSAAMAVRTALQARQQEQTLIFLVPEANALSARFITAALLIGNHAHANGDGELPPEEVRPLFKGDVLLVTSAVSESKNELDEVPIGPYKKLSDYWDAIPLSKYTTPHADKPRVFLANPGWALAGLAGRRFGAIVIDGSHPRTTEKLPELVRAAAGCSSIRVVIAPPLGESSLAKCGYPTKAAVWLWDPSAAKDAEVAAEEKDSGPVRVAQRTLWVCDSDAEAADTLARLHRHLSMVTREVGRAHYPGLSDCWSIYSRLRHLPVPLAQLEQLSAGTWSGALRERIDALASVQGHGDALWDSTWRTLHNSVLEAYQVMLKRDEPAKFWAVATRVNDVLNQESRRIRIVTATEAESRLLVEMLGDVVDNAAVAVAEGRLEVVTSAQEARLVAEGQPAPTVLFGPRTNGHRYLDAYPSQDVDEFVYPYEVDLERAAQRRVYEQLTALAADAPRLQLLDRLGLRPPKSAQANSDSVRPTVTVQGTGSRAVRLTTTSDLSQELDIDSLAEDYDYTVFSDATDMRSGSVSSVAGDWVEVTFTTGGSASYYATQNVDVYFSASGTLQRESVRELKPGWRVIWFVDGRYDSLFKRLTEVVSLRLPTKERIALELWQRTKDELKTKHKSMRSLYETLVPKGMQSSYDSFTTWFRDSEEGVLAPQQFEEFKVLAAESATYAAEPMLKATFEAVQRARGRNRGSGRMLKRFLRAVVSGDGYDEALASARKLDTALGDVLAAVDVLEVKSIRVIARSR